MSKFTRVTDPARLAEQMDVVVEFSSSDAPAPIPIQSIIQDLHKSRIDVSATYDLLAEQAKHPFLATVPVSVPDLPDTLYHSIKAWSKSMISNMKDSPAHLRYALDHPRERTDAMMIGSATHTMVLENSKFEKLYAVKPDVKMNTNVGKAEYSRWLEEDPSRTTKEHLKLDDYRDIKGMRESIMAHPECRKYIEMDGEVELSSFWMDRETGLFLKGRQDKVVVIDGEIVIVDLKTTNDASPKGFASTVYNYEYHVQSAMYCDGISETFDTLCTKFIFIAVEKDPPYVCAAYLIEPEAIAQGRTTQQAYLSRINECVAEDKWPGYSDFLEPISIPKFALPQERY